jgi:solute carrier family 38 (sodium-coupled neutral amino acid transporter), member 2
MVMPISTGGEHDTALADEASEPLLPRKQQRRGDHGEDDDFHDASFAGAVFNLSTTIVGAGIMALPATMKVLAALLTEASIELLVRFSRAGGATSYGAVMGDAFGKLGRGLLQACVVVNNVGIMVVYMIIIGKPISFLFIY